MRGKQEREKGKVQIGIFWSLGQFSFFAALQAKKNREFKRRNKNIVALVDTEKCVIIL